MWIYIDLDGTILDIFERYSGIFNLYAKQYGKHLEREEYKKLRQAGVSDLEIFKQKWNLEIDREAYKSLKHQYLESPEWLKKDTVIGNPEILKKYDCKFAILTQRNRETETLQQIKSLELDKVFDAIIVLKPCKGKNVKLEYLRNRVEKADWIIGDSTVELECARELGMQGCFVCTGLFGTEIVKKERIESSYLDCVRYIVGGRGR